MIINPNTHERRCGNMKTATKHTWGKTVDAYINKTTNKTSNLFIKFVMSHIVLLVMRYFSDQDFLYLPDFMGIWLIGVKQICQFFCALFNVFSRYSGQQRSRGSRSREKLVYEQTGEFVFVTK